MRLALLALLATTSAAAAQTTGDAATRRVRALMEAGQYGDALVTARRHDLHGLAGEIRFRQGEWDLARAAWERALGTGDSLAARLGLARLAEARGDLATARAGYDGFIDVYNRAARLSSEDLTLVGDALRRLSAWRPELAHDALRAYDEAIAADSGNLEARLGVGALFLERYSGSEAARTFRAVLAVEADHPRALLGLAKTHRFAGLPDAAELAGRALARNPRLVEARAFLAALHLEEEDYEAADRELHQALAVNPSSLEALAVQAAVRFLTDDTAGYRAVVARALALNPRYADLYVTVAEAAARNRRYADAAALSGRGVALDSGAARAWAVMGVNQLRIGAIDRGRTSLERAFAGDPFDLWTKNTLDLLDTLVQYPVTTSPRFAFHADGGESAVLSLYLAPLAEEAYERLAARYDHRPATPVRIEVYPTHADFSVRTVGLAGLGALGVSFGPVIAMDSPSARDRGTFNWGSTLWHEIAHTFHLGLSRHRVPRWFTEGLAVLEERRARPGWGDGPSPGFLLAWRHGRLHAVGDLNEGFVRPRYPEEIGYSYYLASLVTELIERDHGPAGLRAMLAAYGRGLDTEAAFADVLGTSLDAFEARFATFMAERFAGPLAALERPDTTALDPQRIAQRARQNPDDYLAQVRMGHFLVREGRGDAALPYFERARVLFPEYAGPDGPYPALARLYAARGNWDSVTAVLSAYTALDETAWDAHLALARRREAAGDVAGAAAALDAAMYITPLDLSAHEYLAELYRRLAAPDREIRERRAVLALQPGDPAGAWYRLARAYLSAGAPAEARTAVLRALEIAPSYAEAQDLLLRLVERGGTP